jgi:beta-fructofuranosidase
MNDPLGLTYRNGTYHTFFQHNPHDIAWDPRCHWGHATSKDLLTWEEGPTALAPGDGDGGCWSGCLVSQRDIAPIIFYTSVTLPDFNVGVIRRAHAAEPRWNQWVKDQVVARVPGDLDAAVYRDPYVFRDDGCWRMLVGAGLKDGTATALTYASDDLEHWAYTGPLAERSSAATDSVWTGSLWECPQLIRIGDRHVLIVSVWHNHELYHVAYSVGSYNDGRFTPGRWRQLTHGTSHYAASTFTDAQGNLGLVTSLRGVGQPNGPSIGAMSLPMSLQLDDQETLSARPHPSIKARRHKQTHASPREPTPLDLEWTPRTTARHPAQLNMLDENGDSLVRIVHYHDRLVVTTKEPEREQSMLATPGTVRIVVDGPVLEVFSASGPLAVPLPSEQSVWRPSELDEADSLQWWHL